MMFWCHPFRAHPLLISWWHPAGRSEYGQVCAFAAIRIPAMPSPHLGVQSMICIPPRAPFRWHDSCRIPHTQPMVIGTHCHLSQVLGFRVQALFRLISSEPHPALRVLRQRLPEAAQFFQCVTCTFQNCLSPRCKPPPPIQARKNENKLQ